MRRSSLVWVSIFGLPGAFACNLILGNETPGVAGESTVANDASVSSSSSSSSSGTPADPDANLPVRDAGPDATDDHPDLPASRLVFVNGNPESVTGNESLSPQPVTAYVLPENEPIWRTPPPAPTLNAIYLASPAVFYVGGYLYVVGGELPDGTTSTLASYAALKAPIVNDIIQPWSTAPAFITHTPSRCSARVNAVAAPAQVDVLCGVHTGGDGVVLSYSSDLGDNGLGSWTPDTYASQAGGGVVYSAPFSMRGISKSEEVDDDKGQVSWSRQHGFSQEARGVLPELADACAVSFQGHSYVVVAVGPDVETYLQADDATWYPQTRLLLKNVYLHDLTCAASERGLYFAAANTQIVDGKPIRVSYLYRALANNSAAADSGIVLAWDQSVAPPPMHDPGGVLISIPLSAVEAGEAGDAGAGDAGD